MNATAALPTGRPAAQAPPPLRVFFVEDSPVILELLISTLQEMLDVEVLGTAATEASGLRWLRGPDAGLADVMIVDLFLAQGSGLSVLQAAHDLNMRCPRVVLTNYASPAVRERCSKLGASRIFDKSTELVELVAFLGEIGPMTRR
jgi:DNA-binding NarL/FixJ family response regulator